MADLWDALPNELWSMILVAARLPPNNLLLVALTSRKMREMVEDRRVWAASFAGAALVWGRGRRGQLGCGRIQRCTATRPKLVRLPPCTADASPAAPTSVAAVSAAKAHTLVLSGDGRVFACGSGDHCRLGGAEKGRAKRGRDARWVRRPVLLASLPADGEARRVKQVAAGHQHSLLLTEEGHVYSFGEGLYGCLGHGDRQPRQVPTLITQLVASGFVAMSVSVGRRHSLVLSDSGMLMGFGGLEGRGMPVFAPVPSTRPHPDAATRVAAVASGAYFCVILTTTGQVHLLGNLLGTRVRTPLMHRRVALEPTAAAANDDKDLCAAYNDNETVVMVSAVAAGDRHALLLTGDGRVFGLGSTNGRGQARRGEPRRDDAAYEVTGDRGALAGARARVRAVAAGSAHSVALTTDGRLWAFGCDRDGQCGVAAGGLSVVALPRLLTSLVPTSAVAAGGTRTYALI